MPVNWTIAGQTGSTFNATQRTLAAAQIDSARLDFKSLEADILTFTITPESLASAVIPDLRQEMILYRDGVRFFSGNVTNVRNVIDSGKHQCQVTVSGPWWWLEKIPFTSVIADGTGVSQERISYVFGTASAGQNLKTSIEAAINRSAALGAPIATIAQGSSVDAMFVVPRITLNQSTCGQVISELVRICPDTMVWFDYSTAPVRIRVGRRGATTAVSLNQSISPITSIDINPVIDLEVSNVVLPFVDRDTQGRTRFQVQSAGTNATSKRQIITVSGPELDTFLPNDLFDSQTISVTNNFGARAYNLDVILQQTAKKYGFVGLPTSTTTVSYRLWDRRATTTTGTVTGATYTDYVVGSANLSNKSGTILTGYKIITSDDPADWVGINVVDALLYGQFRYIHTFDTQQGSTFNPYPAWASEVGLARIGTGFDGTTYYADNITIATKPFSFNVKATNSIAGTSQTFYRPADYSFIAPPANLAANLLAAQNWIPYEGAITLEEEDVGATRYRGNKINLINSIPAYSTMGALVSGESLEIESGRTTISLGAPARNDYRTLVDKIRKTSQDNIVYV
jgi:hypothetical protein